MNRFIKLINLLLVIAGIGAAACAYWFAYRVLPQTSGTLKLPVAQPAKVVRDTLGVPHINAATAEDAVFLQGYVMAQDRLWQMDMARRKASGELSEVVGELALEEDRKSRRLRLRRTAEAQAREMPAEEKVWLAAYARGVNEFIRTHRGALPVEFTVMGYQPRPWSMVDSLVIGMDMHRTLSQTDLNEMRKFAMRGQGDAAKVNFLFPLRAGGEVAPGSNAWVVSGQHTTTGKPILANDTHLEFGFPSTWYQVHLTAPDLDVAGHALPGVPLVIIGHNRHIAWGVTNLHFDVMDLYGQSVGGNGVYPSGGEMKRARLEREPIAVKGGKLVDVPRWVTDHGPVIESLGAQSLALRWAAAEPGFRFIFPALNRAKNWQEFRAALRDFPGPAQNFVYADTAGHIGYQAAGRFPLRPKECDSSVIIMNGGCEWQGFIPFEDLPSVLDPASGIIVTANQNPFPPDYRHPVAGQFSSNYRAQQIQAMLAARAKHDAAGMLVIQKDVYSPFAHWLAKALVSAAKDRSRGNPSMQQAVDVLAKWNGQMEPTQAAPMIVTLVEENLRRDVGNRAAPNQAGLWDMEIGSAVIQRLFTERPAGWFADYDTVLVRALAEALTNGEKRYGKMVDRWEYALDAQGFTLGHPVLSRLPGIGRFFRIGPLPMSGARTTVKQMTRRLGPSMRMVSDLGDWERSFSNITLGQSGQPFSGHFRDQWEAYYVGQSFRMQFARVEAESVLEIVP